MGFISWNDEWNLGIKKIDAEHQKLISIINNLNDAMKARAGRDKISETVKELELYTLYHFRDEEASFAGLPYPAAEGHKAQHAWFVGEVAELRRKVEADPTAVSLEAMDLLKRWFVHHIQNVDTGYRPFIKGD